MKTRAAIIATLAFIAWPATARADFPQPTNVTIVASQCPDGISPACAYAEQGLVYIEPGQDQFVYWHELGHVFDVQRLTPGDRNWFTRMIGLTGAWRQGSGVEGLRSPFERFADAYATCALGWRPDRGQWEDAYGYSPTLKRHQQICAAIRRVGARP